MENTSWLKQTKDEPLLPDLLWSRPENKRSRGKLLIVGGNLHSFAAVSEAFGSAIKAGVGSCRILLPDALSKSLGKVFPEAEFAASSISGSFARLALAQMSDSAEWADGVLLAGDFGKNSETAILLDSFVQKYNGQLTVTDDGLDYFLKDSSLLNRRGTVLCGQISQLQKMAAQQAMLIKQSANLVQLVLELGQWSQDIDASLILPHGGYLICADGGRVSSTAGSASLASLAAYASVWQLQQPAKPFEALSCAAYTLVSI